MGSYTTVKALIDVMSENGVEFLFFNPGIDNVPVLDTLAVLRAEGYKAPRSILCLDEFVAMTAAHGNYMASRKPQVVSVHSELGVLQIGGALHNAQWGRVPLVFFTESLGPPQRTNWRGESFDQGMMVRNFVKWDHFVAPNEDPVEVFREAFRIATTEPFGPVYLSLPRETLWNTKPISFIKTNKAGEAIPPKIDNMVLEKIAVMLLSADNPLIVTGYSGRNPDAVESLINLAETLGAPVMTADTWVNFPNTHPLTAFSSPSAGHGGSSVAQSDVVLAIDYDMHYASPPTPALPNTKIIHIDSDTAKKGVPLWSKKPEILLNADSSIVIPELVLELKKKISANDRERCLKRAEKHRLNYNKIAAEWKTLAVNSAKSHPISAHWLSHCINEVIDEDTIVVNQTISPAAIVAHQIRRSKPASLFSCAGGCIGWAPGAALGVKLAAPDKTVISLMGDGAFIYGCPEASLWSANHYKAPFLAIIYDNLGYGAIKSILYENHDEENTAAAFYNPPDYSLIARANGAYGRMVENPEELPMVLKDCLAMVRNGQTAVLDVRIDPV